MCAPSVRSRKDGTLTPTFGQTARGTSDTWPIFCGGRRARQARAGHGGLAVGDAAVVHRDRGGDKDREPRCIEGPAHRLEQDAVHEDPAGERNGIDAMAPGHEPGGLGHYLGDLAMQRAGELIYSDSCGDAIQEGTE